MKLPADRETWQRVEPILDQVIELPAEQRDAVLGEACAGRNDLRAEVEAYLAADARAERFLETPVAGYAQTLLAAPEPIGGRPSTAIDRLGPYEVIREIGAGGMGRVYEGRDTRLGRRVALKLLPPEWSRDRAAKERFVREARATAALDHPNICAVHDVGESDDGQLFIVMAYYEGETVEQMIDRGPLAPGEARDLAIQVARGLEQAHAAGVVHRDIKPSNVMVTDVRPGDTAAEGPALDRAKILDFGIARVAGTAGLTQDSVSPGTPAYMSPEQATGRAVDERTDVWSLGVMLYEMLAGRRPFTGEAPQALIYQIVNRRPVPLGKRRPEVPAALAGVVAKAMAKEPAERYQSVAELRADLESGTAPPAVSSRRWRRRLLAVATMVAVAILAALGFWWARRDGAPAGPSSLAVLRFDNLENEAEIDWLRHGLAELLITDLSQSPEIDVLELAPLDRLLAEARTDDTTTPASEPAEVLRGKTDAVLRGSFVRNGDRLRINFKIETFGARSPFRDWVEDSEERLFSMVDEVSRAARRHLGFAQWVELTDSIQQVTTSSYDAWRSFSKGHELCLQARWKEARPYLENAVSWDPEFALALTNLGILHKNLGNDLLASRYTRRAYEHLERLPVQERHFVEGEYHSATWSGYERAIAAYRRGLVRLPDDFGLRRNLALHLAYLERYEEASEELQVLLDRGDRFGGTHHSAATVQGALGNFEAGREIVAAFAERFPESTFAQLAFGWYLSEWQRYDEAGEQFRRAEAISPGDVDVAQGRWRLSILLEDWQQAAYDARQMSASDSAYGRWMGEVLTAWTDLYAGRRRSAMVHLDASTRAYPRPEANTALAHCWRARLALQVGRAEEALVAAESAQRQGPGDWPELEGLFLAALAHQALGHLEAADDIVETLQKRSTQMPNAVQRRQLHHLAGRLALARGEPEQASRELEQAAELLPPRGFWFHWHILPDHVPLWYALGEAESAAGRPERAVEFFRRVAESGAEHLEHPVLFVRSFYHLGRLYEALGDTERSAEAYGRFGDFWHDGDLDRAEIERVTRRAG